MFASLPLPGADPSGVLKYFSIPSSLPVKCSRLKLIVRANHLYSPLTRDPGKKKMWPSDTDSTCVPLLREKENIPVCKAPLPWIISVFELFRTVFTHNANSCIVTGPSSWWQELSLLWACQGKGENVQTARRKKPPLVPVLATERQREKAIKASFSSAVWPVLFPRVFILFSSMDDRPAVWTERGHQIRGCWRSGHNFPTLEDGKEEKGWRRLEGMGHLGIFFFFFSCQ